jgi:hypothetical protein
MKVETPNIDSIFRSLEAAVPPRPQRWKLLTGDNMTGHNYGRYCIAVRAHEAAAAHAARWLVANLGWLWLEHSSWLSPAERAFVEELARERGYPERPFPEALQDWISHVGDDEQARLWDGITRKMAESKTE